VTARGERRLGTALWTLYGILGAAGLAVLALALFIPPKPAEFPRPPAPAPVLSISAGGGNELASRLLTRRVAAPPKDDAVAGPKGPAPIDQVVRLKGVLDFGAAKPAVAVLELPGERKTKSFQAGDKIGTTGAVLRTVGESVIVDYEKRRWKLTYKGAQEIPGGAVGDNR